jgi:hypothetical protein
MRKTINACSTSRSLGFNQVRRFEAGSRDRNAHPLSRPLDAWQSYPAIMCHAAAVLKHAAKRALRGRTLLAALVGTAMPVPAVVGPQVRPAPWGSVVSG